MGRSMPVRPTRDDDTRVQIRRTLARLAGTEADIRAELAQEAAGPDDLIGLVTRRIEDTVLPRSYALIGGGREVARLSVSNRRLMALDLMGAEEDMTPPTQSAAQVYARRLHFLAARGLGPIRVHLRGRAADAGGGIASCSARALAKSFAALDRNDGLEGVFDLIRAQSLAWLRCDHAQGETACGGPEDLLMLLRTLSPEPGRTVCPKVGCKPACSVIGVAAGRRAVIATDGTECLLAMIPEAGIGPLIAAWRTLQRPA